MKKSNSILSIILLISIKMLSKKKKMNDLQHSFHYESKTYSQYFIHILVYLKIYSTSYYLTVNYCKKQITGSF